jgi:hypothetical protein
MVRLVSDTSNVLTFPGETRARASVELLIELARSLVDTLTTEPSHVSSPFRGHQTICSKLLGWTAPRHRVPDLGL